MKRGLTRLALLLFLALVLALSLAVTASAADRWTDITDQQWVNTYQITATQAATVADGYPDGTFRPYLPVNRGQFSKMAVNGLGLAPYDPATPTFSDVIRGSTFYGYIEGAAAAGVVSGYPDGSFRPTTEISRQQAATMLGRVVSNAELDAQGSIMGTAANYATLAAWYQAEGDFYLGAYLDWQQIEPVHRPTTAYLIYRQVVSGSDLRLNPTGTLMRAQAVAMVLRALAAVGDVTHVTPPAAPTDMTVTPTGPSSDMRPFISGRTVVPGGDVVVYDTFGGATTELAQVAADAAGEFTVRVSIAKALQEGLHSFTAKVKDSRGRVSDASQAVAYRVDLTAPQATITAPVNSAALFTPKPAFTVDATDTGSGVAQVVFQYAADVTVPAFQTISTATTPPYQAAWTGVGLPADDRYKLRAIVTDRAGNQMVAGPITILLDRQAPTAEISTIGHTLEQGNVWFTADRSPEFTATALDPAPVSGGQASGIAQVSFYYALNASVPADPTTTAGFTLISSDVSPAFGANFTSELPIGDYRFAVQSVDKAGNVSAIDSQQIVVDDQAPVVNVTAPAQGQVLRGGSSFNITWTATDVKFAANPIKIEFLRSGDPTVLVPSMANAGTYTWTVPTLDATNCAIRVTATDAMGRLTAALSGTFSLDSTGPAVPVITGVSDADLTNLGIDGRDFSVTWTLSDPTTVATQRIYILKTPTTLVFEGPGAHAPVATIGNNTARDWTGTSGVIVDSAGLAFDPLAGYRVYVVALDALGNPGVSAPGTWPATAPNAATGLATTDSNTALGVTGEDFSAIWIVSSSLDVIRQDIYILPAATPLVLQGVGTHTAVAGILNNTQATWTGLSTMVVDSAGTPLAAVAYKLYVVAVSDDGRKTASAGADLTPVNP